MIVAGRAGARAVCAGRADSRPAPPPPAALHVLGLGAVVREHPDLVRRIVDGHELACHGMNHRPVWRATPESFRDELREFRQVVTDALGEFPVIGFRAPTFSIDRSNPWALDVLRAEGYRYDSSIFPMKVKMYGTPRGACWIYRPSPTDLTKHDPHADLVEFPVATAQVYRVRFPLGGGLYTAGTAAAGVPGRPRLHPARRAVGALPRGRTPSAATS